jgi:hypothetical protein
MTTWTILQLESAAGTGMVLTIHWEATNATARAYGTIELPPADPEHMIPYDDLTPATVAGWLHDAMGQAEVARIEAAIAAQLAPPSIVPGLPWEDQ